MSFVFLYTNLLVNIKYLYLHLMKNSDSWYLSVTLKNDFRTLPLSSAQVHISEKRKPSCNKHEIVSICLNNLTLGIDMKIYICMMTSSYLRIILSFRIRIKFNQLLSRITERNKIHLDIKLIYQGIYVPTWGE